MASIAPTQVVGRERQRGWPVAVVLVAALLLAVWVVVLSASWNRWDPVRLILLAAVAIIGDLASVDAGSAKVRVSGTLAALILTAVLLGGGPAALVGVVTISVGWFRSHEKPLFLLSNLAAYAWFPLLSGLFFYSATHLVKAGPNGVAYYAFVFPAFLVALLANFAIVAGCACYFDGSSLVQKFRDLILPVLSAELFSAVLVAAAVYFVVNAGTVAIVVLLVILAIFQYLVGELLTSQRRAEELQRKATTDELTGLANRQQFSTEVEKEIIASARDDAFAVMLIDLDHFKEINDTLGHHYGDVLLKDLGPRLAECVGDKGVVARLGGDEFAVLPAERTDDQRTLERIAANVTACVQQPLVVDQMTLEVGASIGISRFPLDGSDASALLRRADIAMYKAKEDHSTCKLYEAEMDRHSARRLTVLSDFRRALKAEEFVVHYQPIVEVGDSHPRGAEGLVRWEHPDMGLIPPSDFIPIAEQSGLIGLLTRHVLERAIEQCAGWRQLGAELTVSVNLSVRDLLDRDLPGEIERMLSAYRLPSEALQLEITESMIMSDPERALATVSALREAGVEISVDDFGTGYSSLANLKRLPISELKIDRSFVSPMLEDESDLIIVRSTINLGHDLGLIVIAEGVEDERTLKQLELLGCDLAQGYHVSRPLTAEAFTQWIGRTNEPALRVAAG